MKWYYWVGIIITVFLGISTLFPAPGENTFAPVSTIILLVIAGIIYWVGKKKEIKPT